MRSASMPPAAGTGLEPGFRGVICASFGSTDDTAGQNTGDRPRHDLRFHLQTRKPSRSSGLCSAVHASVSVSSSPARRRRPCSRSSRRGLRTAGRGDDPPVTKGGRASGFIAALPHRHHYRSASGSEVDCQGCATTLAITNHFSRRIGGVPGILSPCRGGT